MTFDSHNFVQTVECRTYNGFTKANKVLLKTNVVRSAEVGAVRRFLQGHLQSYQPSSGNHSSPTRGILT